MRIYQCRVCGNEFASIRWTFTRCPHCGSLEFLLVRLIKQIAASFNGRMLGFEPGHAGSTPAAAAIQMFHVEQIIDSVKRMAQTEPHP